MILIPFFFIWFWTKPMKKKLCIFYLKIKINQFGTYNNKINQYSINIRSSMFWYIHFTCVMTININKLDKVKNTKENKYTLIHYVNNSYSKIYSEKYCTNLQCLMTEEWGPKFYTIFFLLHHEVQHIWSSNNYMRNQLYHVVVLRLFVRKSLINIIS